MTLVHHEKIDVTELASVWLAFDGVAKLRAIRDEADYDHVIDLMNRVLDAVGDDEAHPLCGLLDLIAALVTAYEDVHYRMEAGPSPGGIA